MRGQFRSILQAITHSVTKQIRRTVAFTKLSIVSAVLVTASLIPTIALIGTAHAEIDCGTVGVAQSGSGWLSGSGVNICNHPGDGSNACAAVSGASQDSTHCSAYGSSGGFVWSGTKWQCVEMVNRLYLTKGWTTSTLMGNGNSIINDVHNHTGLSYQNDSSISYLNPGDVITETYSTDGHAGIIDSIGTGTYPIHIKSQNADLDSYAKVASGTSLSAGNAHLVLNGWIGYAVQAVIHHSPSTPTPSDRPSAVTRDSSDMDTFYRNGSNNNLVDRYWSPANDWNSKSWADNIASAPAGVARDSSDMDVLYRNTGNNLVDRYWNSTTGWNVATIVSNGTVRGNPTVIARDSTHLDVFYRDNSNNLVDAYWVSGVGWNTTYWADSLYSSGTPAALTRSSTSMDVFFRNSGNNLVDRYWSSSLGWNSALLVSNGTISSDPGIVAPDANHMDAFYKDGTTGNLYDRWWDSSLGWNTSSWSLPAGSDAPAAVSRNSGSMEVFFKNPSSNLVDQWWTSSLGWNTTTLDSSGKVATSPSAIYRDSTDTDVFYGTSSTNMVDEYWNSSVGWNQAYWIW